MSNIRYENITCPRCKKASEFAIWESINVKLCPEAKERVITGDLFQFECPDCHTKMRVSYPTLYHDPEKKYMIYCIPAGADPKKSAELTDSAEKTMAANRENKAMAGYRYRMTDSVNALREKVLLFENDLDDRVVEIMKFFTVAGLLEKSPEVKIGGAYFGMNKDGSEWYVEVLCQDGVRASGLKKEFYERIRADFAEVLHGSGETPAKVDADWVRETVFTKKKDQERNS